MRTPSVHRLGARIIYVFFSVTMFSPSIAGNTRLLLKISHFFLWEHPFQFFYRLSYQGVFSVSACLVFWQSDSYINLVFPPAAFRPYTAHMGLKDSKHLFASASPHMDIQ